MLNAVIAACATLAGLFVGIGAYLAVAGASAKDMTTDQKSASGCLMIVGTLMAVPSIAFLVGAAVWMMQP